MTDLAPLRTPPIQPPVAPPVWPAYRRVRELESLYRGHSVPRISGWRPRVIVVGAGLAGLVAARLLHLGGCEPDVFDASLRPGGRMRTDHGTLAPGVVTELGGEFIDTAHADMIALARTFYRTPIDTGARSEAGMHGLTHIGSRTYSEAQIQAAFEPFAGRIRADAQRLTTRLSRRRHSAVDVSFDRLSIDAYLDQLGMDGWLKARICSGYTTLNGLDSAEQSSINLLQQIETDPSRGFSVFGRSDERWKVAEGLDTIIDALSFGLGRPVRTEHRLMRMRRQGTALSLDFSSPAGTVSAAADVVILAIPFTLLRQVDTAGVFLPHQRHAIDHLAYGTNCKLMIGTHRRLWRDLGSTGDVCSDGLLQCGWDGSRLRPGSAGVYTAFLGGRTGLEAGRATTEGLAQDIAREASTWWPGFEGAMTGQATRLHWPSEPWAQASYSTYTVGQRTSLSGDEGGVDRNVYVAGEHCASRWQGYMQGAAETGRTCALDILRRAARA